MATATERLQEITQTPETTRPKVALDTCCVRYYINRPPVQPWADCLDPVFRAALAGRIELYVSTVVLSELLSHFLYTNRNNAGYDPELDLLAILDRHFQILDVDGAVARAAGRLRGNYLPDDKMTLHTPDALIGATSLTNGHTLFITNDAQLADALPDDNCLYLRDVALEWLAQNFPNPCFDARIAVSPSHRGRGLLAAVPTPALDLGAIRPDPSTKWRRILKDAQVVASAVNEPCAFFVLTEKDGRRWNTRELLFWHEGFRASRPPSTVSRKIKTHLEAVWDETAECYRADPKKRVHALVFTSLVREHARQNHPQFASKTDHQKKADAWKNYLALWRTFGSCLDLPQTTWLLCEDGRVRVLDVAATIRFLDQAKNVLGWNDER
jgi:predicted nucleic acid-binding protein